MRLLSVHVLGLLRQAQEDRTVSPSGLSSFVWGMAKAANNPRKLWDYESNYEDEGTNDDFFDWGEDSMLPDGFDASDMFTPELAECGIDVTNILESVMDGGMIDNFDPNEMSPDFLEFLADDEEKDCTMEQETQFKNAFASFASCTGWEKFVDDKEALDKLADELKKECGDFMPNSPLEVVNQVDFNDMDECLDVVLGDNPLGDFLRDFYHNPGRNCECATAFEDAVPSCLIHSLDEEIVVPGSLFKKASCLVGKACDTIEEVCQEELGALDECLPPLDGKKSCYKIEFDCTLEGSMSLVLPPKLTMGELPDTCKTVNEEDFSGENIAERLSAAYHKCGADDDDADLEGSVQQEQANTSSEQYDYEDDTETNNADESSSSSSSSSSDDRDADDDSVKQFDSQPVETFSEPYVSKPYSTEYMNAMEINNKPGKEETQKTSQAVLGIGLAVAVGIAVVAFLITKVARANARDDSDPSKHGFTQMPAIHSDGVEDSLVVPVV